MRIEAPARAVVWAYGRSRFGDVASLASDDLRRARRPRPGAGPVGLVVGRRARGVRVLDASLPGDAGPLPVRVYSPADPGPMPLPVVVHFHGGGWAIGDHRSADWLCSGIAVRLGVVVASVGYRLAPEHPAPAAALDCFAATRHLAVRPAALGGGLEVDAARIAVMGDSAGGNLAAVVALQARDAGGPRLAAQVLIYPGTDATLASPSLYRLAAGPALTLRDIHAYLRHYLGEDGDPRDPLISPLLAPSHAGLAPALIQTAEHDPLVDDGSRYAAVLRAAGVPVRYTCYLGAMHGYTSVAGISRVAAQARSEIEEYLALALGLPAPVPGPQGRPLG
ncbi:MAG TPA: alpha/beta hydrolase [Kineosporiaceae bacterium]